MRWYAVAVVALLTLSCSAPKKTEPSTGDSVAATTMAQLKSLGYVGTPAARAVAAEMTQRPDRKLVRTAALVIEVRDAIAAVAAAGRAAADAGGEITGSETTRYDDGHHRAKLTMQVPADRFDGSVAALARLGEVKSQRTDTADITKAYSDLETRLAAKRQTEQRLRALIQDRTGKLSDVLDVERALEEVITNIEQMEIERRQYDRQVAESTIELELFEPGTRAIAPGPFVVVADAARDAVRVLGWSLAAVVYAITFGAPWVVIVAVAWWIVRPLRARRAA